MRKAFLIALMCIMLTGCNEKREYDQIQIYGRSNWKDDDTAISLKDGWFACGYNIDYEKGQIVIQIEKLI